MSNKAHHCNGAAETAAETHPINNNTSVETRERKSGILFWILTLAVGIPLELIQAFLPAWVAAMVLRVLSPQVFQAILTKLDEYPGWLGFLLWLLLMRHFLGAFEEGLEYLTKLVIWKMCGGEALPAPEELEKSEGNLKPGLTLLVIAILLSLILHPWALLLLLLAVPVLALLGPSREQRRKQRQLAIQQRKQAEQLQPPTQ